MTSRGTLRTVLIGVAVLILWATPAPAQTADEPVRLTGGFFDLDTGRTDRLIIDITRWSTSAETDRLLGTLEEEGQAAFLTALRKNRRVGSFRTPGHLAYDLHYAAQTRLPDGGRAIVLGTDRQLSFMEMRNQTRSVNYPFIWIEIHLNEEGNGDGRMSLAAKLISAGGRNLVLENYDVMQPARLTELRTEKLKR